MMLREKSDDSNSLMLSAPLKSQDRFTMHVRIQHLAFITPLLLMTVLSALARTWTDLGGRSLDAELIEQNEDFVKVRRSADFRIFKIPLDQLSPKDQSFLLSLREKDAPQDNVDSDERAGFPEDGLKWPLRVSLLDELEIDIIEEDSLTQTYIYHSNHFEFRSTVKLARSVVSEFAEIFESTFALVQASPLDWNLNVPDSRFKAQFFETAAQYLSSGGLAGSAGMYNRGMQTFYIPLDQLGGEKGSTSITFDKENFGTLIHEVTHQVQHDWLSRMPTWLVEGYADYIQSIPHKNGTFQPRDVELAIPEDTTFRMVDPAVLMQMSGADWNANFGSDSYALTRQYRSAYLLTYYFLHLDGDGDGRRIWNCVRALETANPRKKTKVAREQLLDGRSDEELFESMQRAFKREDVDLEIF